MGILDLKAFTGVTPCDGKRDAERKGARFLLASMLNDQQVCVSYTDSNRPYLEGRREHISISHSHDRLAIALNSAEATGIDIELVRDKVVNVAHKFVNAHEAEFAGDDVEKLILLWAAKEALYKAGGEQAVDFRRDMSVTVAAEHLLNGEIRLQRGPKRYLLFHKRVDDYMLVFTLHEI